MTVVYVDVLLTLNFMVNFVLLRAAALCAGRRFSSGRGALAALIGAVSALSIFLPISGVLSLGLLKLGVCALMTATAFRFEDGQGFLRDLFCLFTVSFLFSGLMLALYLSRGPAGMTVYNGVVYFDISALWLLAMTALAYLAVSGISRLLRRRTPEQELCEVLIFDGEALCVLPALLDNGNRLTEPFSGLPAMVCGAEDLGRLLPKGLCQDTPDSDAARAMGFRLIPFDTVGGGGMLPAFVPKTLRIRTAAGEFPARAGC
ncbi:MAG: sigma-E processing peptidase SpoIIGA [Oscillospiraceae bacterium]